MTGEPMMMPSEAFASQPRMRRPPDFSPEESFPSGHRWAGKPRCVAWSSINGRQCNRIPMNGKTVCRSHGGAGGRPPKHGKYTGPARLHAAYRRAAGNPKDFDLRPEIALLVSRIQLTVDRLEEVGGIVDPAEILKAAAVIRRGVDCADLGQCEAGLALLTAACETAETERTAWAMLRKDFIAERRLVEAERRWQIINRQMVPGEEVAELVKQIMLIICKHVTDPIAKSRIARDIRALLPRTN